MIDVVFLFLVFFMLVFCFGMDISVELVLVGQGGVYSGLLCLVDIYFVEICLNGQFIMLDGLVDVLRLFVEQLDDIVVLCLCEGVDFQQIIIVVDRLMVDGYVYLMLVE